MAMKLRWSVPFCTRTSPFHLRGYDVLFKTVNIVTPSTCWAMNTPFMARSSAVSDWAKSSATRPRTCGTATASCCRPKVCTRAGHRSTDDEFDGMMFIGRNHFNPAERVTVEANLFDFDRDIYDDEIIVYPNSLHPRESSLRFHRRRWWRRLTKTNKLY